MGKKYIIELPENTHWIQWLMEGTEDHHPYMDFKSVEDLTPYTEPDLEQVRKESYDKGYEDAEEKYNDGYSDGYDAGLDDAWKAARDIHRMPDGDILDLFPDCYASVCTAAQAILKYDASEAIAKIKEYENSKQEIKVGDEVEWNGDRYTVTYIDVDETYADVIDCSCGSVCERIAIKNLDKTGRHFPEIAAVLEKMRGDKE